MIIRMLWEKKNIYSVLGRQEEEVKKLINYIQVFVFGETHKERLRSS